MLEAYSSIYFIALFIPFISISGIILANTFNKSLYQNLKLENNKLDFKIFLTSICFVIFIFLGH